MDNTPPPSDEKPKKKRGRPRVENPKNKYDRRENRLRGAFKRTEEHPNLKLTEKLIEDICNCIKRGNYIETSIAMYGVSKSTFYKWCREAANGKGGLRRRLVNEVEKAQAIAEVRDLLRIDDAAESGNWTAAAWKLERRSPKRWGRTDRVEMSGPDGDAIKVQSLKNEEIVEEINRLERVINVTVTQPKSLEGIKDGASATPCADGHAPLHDVDET